MKRFNRRGAPALAVTVLAIGIMLAACAPAAHGGGGGGATTTTSTSTTTTSIPGGPPACTPGAVGAVTLGGGSPVNVPFGWPHPAAQRVDVCWNFGAANAGKAVFIEECKKAANVVPFDFTIDCSAFTQINVNPAVNTDGTGHYVFDLFRGPEPSSDLPWGIFRAGDDTTGVTAPNQYFTGYMRATVDTPANNSQAISVPFTFNP